MERRQVSVCENAAAGFFTSRLGSLLAAITILSGLAAGGAIVYDAQEPLGEFGMFSQLSGGVNNGGVACVPTTAVNSFTYLQNHYGLSGLVSGNPINDINTLETSAYMKLNPGGGVTLGNWLLGEAKWLGERTSDFSIFYTDAPPPASVWQLIYNELATGSSLKLGLLWQSGNGHAITATGFHFNDADGSGTIDAGETATLSFIDPWGGLALTGNLSVLGGNLYMQYSGGAAGGSATAEVIWAMGEEFTAVPEAGQLAASLLTLTGICAFVARRRLNRAR